MNRKRIHKRRVAKVDLLLTRRTYSSLNAGNSILTGSELRFCVLVQHYKNGTYITFSDGSREMFNGCQIVNQVDIVNNQLNFLT